MTMVGLLPCSLMVLYRLVYSVRNMAEEAFLDAGDDFLNECPMRALWGLDDVRILRM